MGAIREFLGWPAFAAVCAVVVLVLYYKSSRKSEAIEKAISNLAKIVSRETISRRKK